MTTALENAEYLARVDEMHSKCSLCPNTADLMSVQDIINSKYCRHIFCVDCFTKANKTIGPSNYICPCCKKDFYKSLTTYEQARLMGLGAFCRSQVSYSTVRQGEGPVRKGVT